GRLGRPARSAGRPVSDRRGRDLIPQGKAVHHRRRRPRQRTAGVGRAGPRRGHAGSLLRPAGQAALRRITHVSADMASWYHESIQRHLAHAVCCIDSFHVVKLATHALDLVRREVWNQARRGGDPKGARWIKRSRWARLKNPERLSDRQQATLDEIKHMNEPLYTAYLLKEQLRQVFHEPDWWLATQRLDIWISWAKHSRLEAFAKAAKTITDYRHRIIATLRYRLTNARTEAVNTTIRLITRRAYGFHSPDALVALAMLKLGGYRPPLPATA